MMPGRYYSLVFNEKGVSVRFVMIDTTPLIGKYRRDTEDYPDAVRQDEAEQLHWLDSTLTAAREQWVVVIGHHPIYAETGKDTEERADMLAKVDPILRRHHVDSLRRRGIEIHEFDHVDVYACGHIHNFQHLRVPGSDIDYVVNSAAALSRKVKEVEGTRFCSPETGFSLIAATDSTLNLHFINKEGRAIYAVKRRK